MCVVVCVHTHAYFFSPIKGIRCFERLMVVVQKVSLLCARWTLAVVHFIAVGYLKKIIIIKYSSRLFIGYKFIKIRKSKILANPALPSYAEKIQINRIISGIEK